MTNVKMLYDNNLYCGFEMEGHAGYNKNGPDIVCASLSAASQLTINGILDSTGLDYMDTVKVCNPADGKLRFVISNDFMNGLTMGPITQAFLSAFVLYVEMLADLYPENIKLERREDV